MNSGTEEERKKEERKKEERKKEEGEGEEGKVVPPSEGPSAHLP
ncbi:hypothetical protein [Cohnella fermenti]|nr:hypothetical protein [Cohnella fermenti]